MLPGSLGIILVSLVSLVDPLKDVFIVVCVRFACALRARSLGRFGCPHFRAKPFGFHHGEALGHGRVFHHDVDDGLGLSRPQGRMLLRSGLIGMVAHARKYVLVWSPDGMLALRGRRAQLRVRRAQL